jgi:UDP-glucose 4-epimerase
MKVVVTGGAGFIGSHIVDRLIALGHEVLVIDHHKKDRRRFPNPQAVVHKTDFGHDDILGLLQSEQPDAILHLAAQISVTKSVADPVFDAQVNIMSSVALLDAARKAGVQRFVFASSGGAIYGDHPERPTPELMDVRPISPYGLSKQTFERYLMHYSKKHSMQSVILRLANAYGPRQLPGGEAAVIPLFLRELLTDGQAKIFGDGGATRDFIFIDDIVDAFIAAIEGTFSGVANIASGEETSVLELLNALKEIHGEPHEHVHLEDRVGEIQKSVLNPERAKRELGWESKTDLRDGLKKTYDWFREFTNDTE